MIGSDTSGLEVNPPAPPAGTVIPVHRYLLVDQGVHVGMSSTTSKTAEPGEGLHVLLCVATTNKIRGAVAGIASCGPIAIR